MHLGPGHVEHVLVSRRRARTVVGLEQPVRVLAGQVGVEVDHLRLEPQAEVHAELVHTVDQRVEAVGPPERVDVPVAQAGPVVRATSEPPVVEHEPLDPDGGGTLGEVEQLGRGRGRRARLPRC